MVKYTGIESVDARIDRKIEVAKATRFFVPRELSECNALISQLQTIVDEHKNALMPWKHADRWSMARFGIKNPGWEAIFGKKIQGIEDYVHNEAWHAGKNAAWKAIRERSSETEAWADAETEAQAATDFAFDAAWETVQDIEGFEKNPFEPIVRIYYMGLIPRDFCQIDGAERFVVDFPLVEKYRLGCWAEGDSKILYSHHYVELDYQDDYRSHAIVHHKERL